MQEYKQPWKLLDIASINVTIMYIHLSLGVLVQYTLTTGLCVQCIVQL